MLFDHIALPIASVACETGFSVETLIAWESRCGFPASFVNARGERIYMPEQVRQLSRIKRLMGRGYPLETLLAMDETAQRALDAANAPAGRTADTQRLDGWMQLVKARDPRSMHRQFHRELAKLGMLHFIQNTLVPLTRLVNEAWARDQLDVLDEQLLWENIEQYFRKAIADLEPPDAGRPRCLLTTLPGETHLLGLLMVEALLMLEDAHPVPLGAETPIARIAGAVEARRIDVVCLSFSIACPPERIVQGLGALRRALPGHVQIWAGGQGVQALRAPIDGVHVIPEFEDLLVWLAGWRAEAGT